ATAERQTAVVEELVRRGAEMGARSKSGSTALMLAAQQGDASCIRILLRAGAKPNEVMGKSGLTPLTIASAMAQAEAIAVLLAAEVNNLEAVKALVDGGADPRIPTEQGTTPLILAAGAGTDVLRPRSPEERAMAVETAKYLVEHGADVNAAGQFGWTALH